MHSFVDFLREAASLLSSKYKDHIRIFLFTLDFAVSVLESVFSSILLIPAYGLEVMKCAKK